MAPERGESDRDFRRLNDPFEQVFVKEKPHAAFEKSLRSRSGRKRQTRLDVFTGQLREFCQNLLLCLSRREIFKYVINSNSHPPNTGLTAALAGFDGYEMTNFIFHERTLRRAAPFARILPFAKKPIPDWSPVSIGLS
jgi:hypothetical protein